MKCINKSIFACFVLAYVLVQLVSCTQLDTFEKNTTIPKYEWKSNFKVTGSFTIKDTAAAYNTYIVLRHTDAYKYNNIWLNVGIQQPGDTMHFQKIELPLGSDASGWMGTGMNDIWEVRQLLFSKRFIKTGTYSFSISQIMRDDPLLSIMDAGLRLEKQ